MDHDAAGHPDDEYEHPGNQEFKSPADWTRSVFGDEIGAERFVLINAIALPIFAIAALAAVWKPRYAWCAVTLAALLGLNGLLHVLGSLAFGRYMPGTVSGLLLHALITVLAFL